MMLTAALVIGAMAVLGLLTVGVTRDTVLLVLLAGVAGLGATTERVHQRDDVRRPRL